MNRLILLIDTLVLVISAVCFDCFTKGLITYVSTKEYLDYIVEYYSSNNADSVLTGSLIFFAFTLPLQIGRLKKRISIFELLVYYAIGLFEIVLLYLIGMDGCSFSKTIVLTKNFWLLSFLVSLCIYFICLVCMAFSWLKTFQRNF